MLEDEIQMVGPDVEAELFHWRARYALEPCLRTTPEIKSKTTHAILPRPNLKSAAQLLKIVIEETKKVSYFNLKIFFQPTILAWSIRNR